MVVLEILPDNFYLALNSVYRTVHKVTLSGRELGRNVQVSVVFWPSKVASCHAQQA